MTRQADGANAVEAEQARRQCLAVRSRLGNGQNEFFSIDLLAQCHEGLGVAPKQG